MPRSKTLALVLTMLAVAGCGGGDSLDLDETGGVQVTRSACPAAAIPAHTGDMTVFNPPSSREARAIDVVATMTKLRSTCSEAGDQLRSDATFEIQAIRSNGAGAREVVVPYFATVVRGGTIVVSKQISQVALRFEDGQLRATAPGSASATVSRAAATLPADIQKQINRRRKAGDADAAVDPMADPAVRAAVSQASFELLVGFQLTPEQLAYNATR